MVAQLATAHPAAVGGDRLWGEHGSGPVAGQPECAIPRLPLCGAVSGAVRPLHQPGGLLQRDRAGQVATAVFAQPDGGRDRRVPLGDHWPGSIYKPCGLFAVDGDRGSAAHHERASVSAHGEAFCGCDLK